MLIEQKKLRKLFKDKTDNKINVKRYKDKIILIERYSTVYDTVAYCVSVYKYNHSIDEIKQERKHFESNSSTKNQSDSMEYLKELRLKIKRGLL